VDFPVFARHQIAFKYKSMGGVYEKQSQTRLERV
jgi:hypothetical protein